MNRNVALNSEMRGEFTEVNALLIGSIGSLTETSEIQLEAYNRAFRDLRDLEPDNVVKNLVH